MDLNAMAQAAWDGAEAKGLHDNLNKVDHLGAREQALLAFAPLTLAVNAAIQHIKRHGVSLHEWDTALYDLETAILYAVEAGFDAVLRLCGTRIPDWPIAPGAKEDATTIRLLLMGTEIAEAIEGLQESCDTPTVERHERLAHELSDVFVRGGDLAHDVGIDLNVSVPKVLQANTQRPYGYNTPLEKEQGHG